MPGAEAVGAGYEDLDDAPLVGLKADRGIVGHGEEVTRDGRIAVGAAVEDGRLVEVDQGDAAPVVAERMRSPSRPANWCSEYPVGPSSELVI